MYQRFFKAMKNLRRGQKGMTGLETAIILIAFVTVASVLAYSVLSAGIFSAERGKATVYSGLESAQATMEVHGSVLGLSPNQTALEVVKFDVGLSIANESVDMTAIIINWFNRDYETQLTSSDFTAIKHSDSTERGTADTLEMDELFEIQVTVPAGADITTYEEFTIQLIPPTGATLTIGRVTPGSLDKVMNLN